MKTDETTGTTPTDDGDAAEKPVTGTPEGEGRDAATGEPDYKAIHLANKQTIEQLKAENEALKMRADQPPADQDDDEDASDVGDEGNGRRRVNWDKVRDFADRGDEVAAAQIENRILLDRLARNTVDTFTLKELDKAEQDEVKKHYARNRHRLGDVKAAAAEIRARKLDAENADLRSRLAAAEKKPPTDVARTHSREVSSTEAKARKMTYAEFDQTQAALRAQGKHQEAMKMQRQLASGEIDAE